MDKPVTKVLKSKSSNSAVTTKSINRKNKKTKSNADFQTSAVKKRGVYVENKDENLDINVQVATQSNKSPNPPPRPRPGKKCFLASVLTILSKSTVATQHPDVESMKDKKNTVNPKNTKKRVINRIETTTDTMKEKKKYKSRVLNHKTDDKLVILQSTKEIVNTPSIYSGQSQNYANNSEITSSYLANNLTRGATSADKLLNREVLEGKQYRNEKITIDGDPSTLIADIDKKDDKGLYNFFVDLLETTFSVYNFKANCNEMTADASTSKIDLEIRESVAERLNIAQSKLIDDVNEKPSEHFYKDQTYESDAKSVKHFFDYPQRTLKEEYLGRQVKRSLNTNIFDYSKKLAMRPKSEDYISKRKPNKASRKQSLLDSLKKQLSINSKTYEEPGNIFAALKLIAKNKRRYEKSIRFNQRYKDGDEACRFKRRRVISTTTRSTSRKYTPESEILRTSRTINPRNEDKKSEITTCFDTESHNSLQVYSFDDETNAFKGQAFAKEIALTYHSSRSLSDHDYDLNVVI